MELVALRQMFDDKLKTCSDEEKAEVESTHNLFKDANDDELIRFLRARKFDSNRAWELMKGYFSYRLRYPDVVSEILDTELKEWVNRGLPGVLPTRDTEGRVVMFFSFENWNPEELPFTKAMKVFIHVLEKLLKSRETQINGVCIVEDFSGYTMSQVAAVGVNEYKLMIDMLQGCFPCRFKGVYCIRQPWYFAKAFNVIKPMLKAKIFERIHVYGEELNDFFNEFSREFLPQDLGGSGPVYDGKAAADMLFEPEENPIVEDTAL